MESPLTLRTFASVDGVQVVPFSEVLEIRVEDQRVWVRFKVLGYSEIEAFNADSVRTWGRENKKLVE